MEKDKLLQLLRGEAPDWDPLAIEIDDFGVDGTKYGIVDPCKLVIVRSMLFAANNQSDTMILYLAYLKLLAQHFDAETVAFYSGLLNIENEPPARQLNMQVALMMAVFLSYMELTV